MTNQLRWAVASSVIVEHLSDGVVLYDNAADKVLCLTGPVTKVIDAATGATVEEIAQRTGLDAEVTAAYLAELADEGLVAAADADPRIARRNLARSAAGVAVAVGVWAVAAPTPAAAVSGRNGY